jgi:hypothetical protein
MGLLRKGDDLIKEMEEEKKRTGQGIGGGAPLGNQNALKLSTPELKQEAYRQYCEHLSRGKARESWYFEHPDLSLTWETVEKYMKEDVDFIPIKKKIATAKGFAYWENVVEDSAKGKNAKANTATLQMLMRNKYGWDKPLNKHTDASEVHHEYYDALMEQISNLQSSAEGKDSKVSASNVPSGNNSS